MEKGVVWPVGTQCLESGGSGSVKSCKSFAPLYFLLQNGDSNSVHLIRLL